MPQAKGSASRVVLDWENSFGVPKSTGKTGKIIPFNSCDLKKTRGLQSSETIRANRNPVEPYLDNIEVAGTIVFPVSLEAIGWILKAAIGEPSSTGGPTYTHVFKIGATAALASLIVEKGFTDLTTPYYELYSGMKINTLSLSVSPSGELLATCGFIGIQMAGSTTAYDSAAAALAGTKMRMSDVSLIKEGGSAVTNLRTLEIAHSNDLDGDTFVIGGAGVRGSLNEGIAKITGKLNALFNNTTLLAKATGATESSLQVTFTSGAYSLDITIPELYYAQNCPAISTPKGVLLDLDFSAYYANDAGASAIIATLVNTTASYA